MSAGGPAGVCGGGRGRITPGFRFYRPPKGTEAAEVRVLDFLSPAVPAASSKDLRGVFGFCLKSSEKPKISETLKRGSTDFSDHKKNSPKAVYLPFQPRALLGTSAEHFRNTKQRKIFRNPPHNSSFFRNRNKNRNRYRKTATGRAQQETTSNDKGNSELTAAQWIDTTRNDKWQQVKTACQYLVRMRSAVRIRPAAPENT